MDQTKYIVMMTKEGLPKMKISWPSLRVGVDVLGCGHIGDKVKMLNIIKVA